MRSIASTTVDKTWSLNMEVPFWGTEGGGGSRLLETSTTTKRSVMRYCNQSPCARYAPVVTCPLPHLPALFSSCQVKREEKRRLTQSSKSHMQLSLLFFSLLSSHLTLSTFSLMLHKRWILNYSPCYSNDPLGLTQRITKNCQTFLLLTIISWYIVSLLSMCSWAKNNWPPVVI